MTPFFLFFAGSGFCSLVYQVTWLRVAMAQFGVTTPSVSIVLSTFMAGLALGSWVGGRYASSLAETTSAGPLVRRYALIEALIGLSGLIVAPLLAAGHRAMVSGGMEWNSSGYYLASGALIAAALLPFCIAMGATFPLGMAAVRRLRPRAAGGSFSFLYMANVLGAAAGSLASAFILIEQLGFRGTMLVAAAVNGLVAVAATAMSVRPEPEREGLSRLVRDEPQLEDAPSASSNRVLAWVFTSGLVSLGMEVVWTRQFVPFMGPVVYTFATILAVYLLATVAGSFVWRWRRHTHGPWLDDRDWRLLSVAAGGAALLPLVVADSRWVEASGLVAGAIRIALGIAPFCLVLGFLTPALLDRVSQGDPGRAGTAYALNTLGCIAGPLLAGFILLPLVGEHGSLALLTAPLFVLGLVRDSGEQRTAAPTAQEVRRVTAAAVLVTASLIVVQATRGFEQKYAGAIVTRDHTATVIAAGSGRAKELIVNGHGMTVLTPITKVMAHLPMAAGERPPEKGLVLCLGMGTSFRSMLSWGIDATVVELVPGIPSLLPFYHADGDALLHAPTGGIVVDDARRFLERTQAVFDVIVIDPPPPLEAAASSLLYSVEFYGKASRRLAPDGVLQQWIPLDAARPPHPTTVAALAKALRAVFPEVRVYQGFGGAGLHLLASRHPLPERSAAELAARLPERARADLVEWGPSRDAVSQLDAVLQGRVDLDALLASGREVAPLSDDKPLNEYYAMLQLRSRLGLAGDRRR